MPRTLREIFIFADSFSPKGQRTVEITSASQLGIKLLPSFAFIYYSSLSLNEFCLFLLSSEMYNVRLHFFQATNYNFFG